MLFLVNIGHLVMVYVQQWDITTILWTYWFQSIIIGIFSAIRLAGSKSKIQPLSASARVLLVGRLKNHSMLAAIKLL